MEMVAYVVAGVVRARNELKAVLDEKMLDKGASAEVLAVTLISAKIVTGDAKVANTRHGFFGSEKSVALRAFDIHLEE